MGTAKELCEQYARLTEGSPHAIEGWLLERGEEFEGVARPSWLRRKQPKACFRNAYELALARSDLTYCEGFIVTIVPVLIHHAWCVDGDGGIVEPTLADPVGVSYFGVRVPLQGLLRVIADSETFGVLYKPVGRAVVESGAAIAEPTGRPPGRSPSQPRRRPA